MANLPWNRRFDRMKSHYGWTNERVAELIGQSAKAIRANTTGDLEARGKKFPSALRGMIIVFEIENGHNLGATVML